MEQNTRLCLGLDTTTAYLRLSLGIIEGEDLQIIHDRAWELGKAVSTLVHTYLGELMTDRSWSDLVYVAVATGVGSFTGTRVGVVIARTLGQELGIPVYGIPCRELGEGKILEIAHKKWRNHYLPSYTTVLPLYEV